MDGTSFLIPSTTRTPANVTPAGTSRDEAAGPYTKTGGGRALDWDSRLRGTFRLKRSSDSHQESTTPNNDVWELYYLPKDFSQAKDLVAQNPDKLKELQDLWWKEAERNKVLPLLGGFSVFFGNSATAADDNAILVRR